MRLHTLGMGVMSLNVYHDIYGIYCDNDINDDNSVNPVSLEKSFIFPIFTQNRVLWALLSTHTRQVFIMGLIFIGISQTIIYRPSLAHRLNMLDVTIFTNTCFRSLHRDNNGIIFKIFYFKTHFLKLDFSGS